MRSPRNLLREGEKGYETAKKWMDIFNAASIEAAKVGTKKDETKVQDGGGGIRGVRSSSATRQNLVMTMMGTRKKMMVIRSRTTRRRKFRTNQRPRFRCVLVEFVIVRTCGELFDRVTFKRSVFSVH